jgi:hypothetical protein
MLPAPLDQLAPRDRSRILLGGDAASLGIRLPELSAVFGHLLP